MANIQDLHDLLKVKADEAIRSDSSSTATRTSFAYGAITSSTEISDTNTFRTGMFIYNGTDVSVYIGFGDTAVSTSNFSVIIKANGYFELPYGFKGSIKAIQSGGSSGSVYLTEFTN
jgi:hypothetical protein